MAQEQGEEVEEQVGEAAQGDEVEVEQEVEQPEEELTEEHKKLLEEIKDAEEELNFLAEYEELLQCDLEEA